MPQFGAYADSLVEIAQLFSHETCPMQGEDKDTLSGDMSACTFKCWTLPNCSVAWAVCTQTRTHTHTQNTQAVVVISGLHSKERWSAVSL